MIERDDENYLTFTLHTDRKGIKLPTLKQCVSMMELSYSFCDVGLCGTVTEPYNFQGTFIDTGNETFGVLPGHEFSPFIFRGANKDWPHLIPSGKRFNMNDDNDKVKHCVEWILKKDFLETFTRTPYYKRCKKFQVTNCKYDFNLEAIAQHYEFISDYLDVTRDINVALFFAYTYFDSQTRTYQPILDFRDYSPVLYVSNLKTLSEDILDNLKTISFQALLRPYAQKALAIDMDGIDEKDLNFKKYELPKDIAFASEIFFNTRRGALYFPGDVMCKVANELKTDKKLMANFFDEYCIKYSADKDWLKSKLLEQGYSFVNNPFGFEESTIHYMNTEIDTGIIPYLNERCCYRGVSELIRL